MKINKKLFDSLTRKPDEVQEIEDKKLEIFFMTDEEKIRFENEGRYSMWTSDGKNYRFLVNKELYDYGSMKEFYTQPVNAKWIGYIEKISQYQRKFLLALMLPLMILYVVGAVLSIIFLKNNALYVLIGMMIVIFIVNAIQSRAVRGKMDLENEKTQTEIQELLTVELYEQIAKDQVQFREMKNKEKVEEYEEEIKEEEKSETLPSETKVSEEPESDDSEGDGEGDANE